MPLFNINFKITDNTNYGSNIASRDADRDLYEIEKFLKDFIKNLDNTPQYSTYHLFDNNFYIYTNGNLYNNVQQKYIVDDVSKMISDTFEKHIIENRLYINENDEKKPKYTLITNTSTIESVAGADPELSKWLEGKI